MLPLARGSGARGPRRRGDRASSCSWRPARGRALAGKAIERDFPGTQVITDSEQALRAGANATLISKAILVIVVIALIIGAISVTNTMALVDHRAPERARAAEHRGLVAGARGQPDPRRGHRSQRARRRRSACCSESWAASLLVRALGVSTYISPSFTAWGLGRGLLVGVAIGVLGGIYPAWRVTRMQPLKALSGT